MRVAVLGAGNSGLAMAAHLAYSGEEVALWNRTKSNIASVIGTKEIKCRGIIEGGIQVAVATDDLEEALDGAEFVFIATPATAHMDLAKKLAGLLEPGVPVLLNPGRTFGALRFLDVMQEFGCSHNPIVGEAQTIVYTCRKTGEDSVDILALKRSVEIGCVDPSDTQRLFSALPDCLSTRFAQAKSFLETSLGNVGPILHCAPFLLNAGWTESDCSSYKYYYDGITPTIGSFVERIDCERTKLANSLHVASRSTVDWLKSEYGTSGESLYECVRNNPAYREIEAPKSLRHRYLYEDIPYGLVQFESLGCALGIEMPCTTLTIDLACMLMGEDFRSVPTVDFARLKGFLRL